MTLLKVLLHAWVTTTPLFFNTSLKVWHSVVIGMTCALVYSVAGGDK